MATTDVVAPKAMVMADFKGKVDPDWCPGCGDFGVLAAVQKALVELQIPTHNVVTISGIGCSSNLPGYINTYGMHTLHGRALAVAGERGVVLWRWPGLEPFGKVQAARDVAGVAFSPDSRLLAWAEGDEVKLRRVAEDRDLPPLTGFGGTVTGVAFSSKLVFGLAEVPAGCLLGLIADLLGLFYGLVGVRPRLFPSLISKFEGVFGADGR